LNTRRIPYEKITVYPLDTSLNDGKTKAAVYVDV